MATAPLAAPDRDPAPVTSPAADLAPPELEVVPPPAPPPTIRTPLIGALAVADSPPIRPDEDDDAEPFDDRDLEDDEDGDPEAERAGSTGIASLDLDVEAIFGADIEEPDGPEPGLEPGVDPSVTCLEPVGNLSGTRLEPVRNAAASLPESGGKPLETGPEPGGDPAATPTAARESSDPNAIRPKVWGGPGPPRQLLSQNERASVLAMLAGGVGIELACRSLGLSPRMFRNTRKADADFAERCRDARQEPTQTVDQALFGLALEGDRTAMIAYLQHHKGLRAEKRETEKLELEKQKVELLRGGTRDARRPDLSMLTFDQLMQLRDLFRAMGVKALPGPGA